MTTLDPNKFVGLGISALAAQEIAAQVTAGVANVDRLLGCGMSAADAIATAALITGGQSDPGILADASM